MIGTYVDDFLYDSNEEFEQLRTILYQRFNQSPLYKMILSFSGQKSDLYLREYSSLGNHIIRETCPSYQMIQPLNILVDTEHCTNVLDIQDLM